MADSTTSQSKQAVQQKYLEYQFLDQQLRQFQQQLSLVEQQISELSSLVESVESVKKVKSAGVMFAPLGSGVFVEGRVQQVDDVVMHVGAGVAVRKPVSDAKEMLKGQVEEARKLSELLRSEMQKIVRRSQELQSEIMALSEKKK